jgi:AraC-like DNA-binding protein
MEGSPRYFDPAAKDDVWGVQVLNGGFQVVAAHESYPPASHPDSHFFTWEKGRCLDEFQMVFVTEGKGYFEHALETGVQELDAPFVMLIFPNIHHRYKPDPEFQWSEYWIGFKGKTAEALQDGGKLPKGRPIVTSKKCVGLLPLFQQAVFILNSAKGAQDPRLIGMVYQILTKICDRDDASSEIENEKQAKIEKAAAYVNEHLDTSIDWESLAASLGMSYSLFRKCFKQYKGLPPKQYHLRARLERAKFLLENSGMNLDAIAQETGFSSAFHLSNQFKGSFGLSPKFWKSGGRG